MKVVDLSEFKNQKERKAGLDRLRLIAYQRQLFKIIKSTITQGKAVNPHIILLFVEGYEKLGMSVPPAWKIAANVAKRGQAVYFPKKSDSTENEKDL